MSEYSGYQEYAESAIKDFAARDIESRQLLVDAVSHLKVERVLDLGCGAGQELLPFAQKRDAFCVGIDIGEELGQIAVSYAKQTGNLADKITFSRARGEELPFADESFDLVLCRVALPYMDNKKAIAEVSRVLSPGGCFLLKTHAPPFYFNMIKERAKTFSPRQVAYPLICIAAGVWHLLTGKQLQDGFWSGKEVFQTEKFLVEEFLKNGMRIEGVLPDTNVQTPSFLVTKD